MVSRCLELTLGYISHTPWECITFVTCAPVQGAEAHGANCAAETGNTKAGEGQVGVVCSPGHSWMCDNVNNRRLTVLLLRQYRLLLHMLIIVEICCFSSIPVLYRKIYLTVIFLTVRSIWAIHTTLSKSIAWMQCKFLCPPPQHTRPHTITTLDHVRRKTWNTWRMLSSITCVLTQQVGNRWWPP